jgi:tetratricopeptide (TPR) repeat protein
MRSILCAILLLFIGAICYAADSEEIEQGVITEHQQEAMVKRLMESQQANEPWIRICFMRDEFLYDGEYEKALEAAKEALKIAKISFGSDSHNVGSSLYYLGKCFEALEQYSEAESYYKQSIEIYGKVLDWSQAPAAVPLYALFELYEKQGKEEEAKKIEERLQSIQKKQEQDHLDLKSKFE